MSAKYKCKLRRFQLSVVSSPGVANPDKVPIIPQRGKSGLSIIATLRVRGGGRGGVVHQWHTKMTLNSSFQRYSKHPRI